MGNETGLPGGRPAFRETEDNKMFIIACRTEWKAPYLLSAVLLHRNVFFDCDADNEFVVTIAQ